METEKRTGLPLITTGLVAVNIAVFLITDLFLFERQEEVAFYMALNPFLVLRKGEYWRIFTSMFYHFGIAHLACNMLMLFLVGRLLEPVFGRICFLILYFGSGLAASGASILYNSVIRPEKEEVVFCAGASGAIYGLIGAFAVSLFLHRKQMPVQEKGRLGFAVIFLLFGSIFDTGVGHDAHFGGFFAGLLLGGIYFLFLWKKRQGQRSMRG